MKRKYYKEKFLISISLMDVTIIGIILFLMNILKSPYILGLALILCQIIMLVFIFLHSKLTSYLYNKSDNEITTVHIKRQRKVGLIFFALAIAMLIVLIVLKVVMGEILAVFNVINIIVGFGCSGLFFNVDEYVFSFKNDSDGDGFKTN